MSSSKIVSVHIQDEEIELLENVKYYIQKVTWNSVDDNEAIRLVVALYALIFASKK